MRAGDAGCVVTSSVTPLAVDALDAPRQRAAMLGLDGGMVDAGLERRLQMAWPIEAFGCLREIEAQAHMGGGEGLLAGAAARHAIEGPS